MKVGFLSPSLSRSLGGIFEIESALAHELVALDVNVEAFGLQDPEWAQDQSRWNGIPAEVYPVRGPRSFGYSPGLARAVRSDLDLLHLHALWMYPSVIASRWGRHNLKPYLVTPNGMLENWALANSKWKKIMAGAFYERRMLNSAACLQANTIKEFNDFRAYGLSNPVAIIPNGVMLPHDVDRTTKIWEQGSEKKNLLFLGRLHPKKGLPNALRAWRQALGPPYAHGCGEWQFVIAGWDQAGHHEDLKRLCRELDLTYSVTPAERFLGEGDKWETKNPQIVFIGPVFGEQKNRLLKQASAFILPSFSEGLPMSVLEAWAYRLPVLMTNHCNLSEGFSADAAIRIGTDVEGIASGLGELFRSATRDRDSMGFNGRVLVERQFTWSHVAEQMKSVYEWVLGVQPRPDCVVEH